MTQHKPITFQDVMDAARQHFIVENQPPAVRPNGGCSYYPQGKNTCGCAWGAVIPDEEKPADGCSISRVIKQQPHLFDIEVLDNLLKADSLQSGLHDSLAYGLSWSLPVEERDRMYAETALRYGLKYERVFPSKE